MGSSESKSARKILFFGLDNAGKTSIVNVLTGESPYAIAPTRGFNLRERQIGDTLFQIFDLGGQKSLRVHWRDYLAGTKGIIWVIDSADPRRMYETGVELAVLLNDDRTKGIPLLIMANKQDLVNALSPDDITVELELNLIRNRNWHIQGCSAVERDRTKNGILDGLKWMEQQIIVKRRK
jgi:small GTP-binding protein